MLDTAHVWKISHKVEEKYLNLTHTSMQMF